eukprot:gene7646-8947_t
MTLPVEQLVSFAPEFEKKLDSAITKRLVDMQESQKTRPAKVFRTLRLSIYNTYSCQSAFYHLDNKAMMTVAEKPSWTLRIEGRLLDESSGMYGLHYGGSKSSSTSKLPKRKFSSFFKKIFVQIGHRDSCEWDKSQSSNETDGFEIKRNGHQEIDIKIMMYLDHTPQKSKVLGPLSQLLNIHTDTKPKILSALWHYIKANRLLDVDGKKIVADEALKNIFGLDTIQFSQIPQLLREHLGPSDPLEFNYTLRLTGDPRDFEQAYDIQVEVDDTMYAQQSPLARKEISALDDEINQTIAKIHSHRRKREFMERLVEDPLGCLSDLTMQQIKDYQLSKSLPSTGFEEERHSSFYYQPMMDDTVQKYLSKQSTPTPTPQTVVPSTPQTDSTTATGQHVVHASVGPNKNSEDYAQFQEAINKLREHDSSVCISSNGDSNYIIDAQTVIHLNESIDKLKMLSLCTVDPANPYVSYRETVTRESVKPCVAKSPNTYNSISISAQPISTKLVEQIDNGVITNDMDSQKRAALLCDGFGWDSDVAELILCIGGANILVDSTEGCGIPSDIREHMVKAFKSVISQGVLCGEPMGGVLFKILQLTLDSDPKICQADQIETCTHQALLGSFKSAIPTLLEPVCVAVIKGSNISEAIKQCLSKLRGTVSSVANDEDGCNDIVTAYIPASETFSIDQLNGACGGNIQSITMTLDHWIIVPSDPLDPSSKANQIIKDIKSRNTVNK